MTVDLTDAELIRRSATEPELFAVIFDRHVGRVHAFLARRAGRDGADPLTGETFRIAFERRATYRMERLESLPWLYGIANNLLRQHWRGLGRERGAVRRLQSRRDPAYEQDDGLLERVAAQALWPAVEVGLRTMRPEERDVILLVAWEELNYDEVADALEIPVGTVRSRLHRARRQLREQISPRPQEDDNPTTSGGRCRG